MWELSKSRWVMADVEGAAHGSSLESRVRAGSTAFQKGALYVLSLFLFRNKPRVGVCSDAQNQRHRSHVIDDVRPV